jgi:hypothetical protein
VISTHDSPGSWVGSAEKDWGQPRTSGERLRRKTGGLSRSWVSLTTAGSATAMELSSSGGFLRRGGWPRGPKPSRPSFNSGAIDRTTEVGAWLCKVVPGYLQYHAVPGNSTGLRIFSRRVCWLWRTVEITRLPRRRSVPCWSKAISSCIRQRSSVRIPGRTVLRLDRIIGTM